MKLLKTYQEFSIFLLLYFANADFALRIEEIEAIIKKTHHLNPKNDIHDLLVEMQVAQEELSDQRILELIESGLREFYSSKEEIEATLDEAFDIIIADGIIEELETKAFERIKTMMHRIMDV